MRTPVTTLDRRYSEANAEPTSWDVTRRQIEDAELFWLTTVRVDGRPHVTPVVAVWCNDALYFGTGENEQKERNLRTNRHVILSTGCNEWREGLDIVLEGVASRVTDQRVLGQLCEVWARKWDGRWTYVARDGHFENPDGSEVLPYTVAPSKILAFAKGAFGHTLHQFKTD
jgi:general stress protein 26